MTSGTHVKVHVRDRHGVRWNVKFGGTLNDEVPAEIAASRLTWALGYIVEESYYVRRGKIEGCPSRVS